MKLTATFATFAAFLTTLASASVLEARDSCNSGGVYCGTSLLNKGKYAAMHNQAGLLIITVSFRPGNYHDHIVDVLLQNGQPTDEAHIDDSLFDCLSGGEIRFCANGCGGTTTTAADFCL